MNLTKLSKIKIAERINLFRVGLFSILIIIPLLPKFPVSFLPGTFVAIRFEDFLILFFSLVWFSWLINFRNLKKFFANNLNLAVCFYLLVGLFSYLSALFITFSVTPHLGMLHYLRRIEYFIPLFIGMLGVRSKNDLVSIFVTLFGVAFLVLVYGVGQIYFSWPVVSTTNEEYSKGLLLFLSEGGRVNSTFAGHYDLAIFLVIVLCFLTSLLVRNKWDRRSFKINLILLLFGIALYWLLVTTESRVAFLSFLLSVCLILFLSQRAKLIVPIFIILLITGAVFSPNLAKRLILTTQFGIEFIQKKLDSLSLTGVETVSAQITKPLLILPDAPISTPAGSLEPITAKTETPAPGEPADLLERVVFRSSGIRFNVEWPRAIRAFLKNPVYGTGFSSITLATDNDYLRALGETGLLGFFSLFLIFSELVRVIRKTLKSKHHLFAIFALAMAGVTLSILVNAVFIDVLEASKIALTFWALVGVLVAVSQFEKDEAKSY